MVLDPKSKSKYDRFVSESQEIMVKKEEQRKSYMNNVKMFCVRRTGRALFVGILISAAVITGILML